jgi:type II restriction enzyme
MKLTASDIVTAIGQLPKDREYSYVSPKNRNKIIIADVVYPEGPIIIKRYNPSKGETPQEANNESISSQMIWRCANAFKDYEPINLDRILAGSYNTRSALEALLAHTPQFYFAYPGRIENISSSADIKKGHKHLVLCRDKPHRSGIIEEMETDVVISEIPSEARYEALSIPTSARKADVDIEVQRRHSQIQIALILIGIQLGYRIWVAKNDQGIKYKNKIIGKIDGVLVSLEDVKLIQAFTEAVRAALLIDCIWFQNDRLMPAVFEIEHTTGVTSGLGGLRF